MTKQWDRLTIKCHYCGHTWQATLEEIRGKEHIIYREGHNAPPEAGHDYLVTCPNCGRRTTVTIRNKGE